MRLPAQQQPRRDGTQRHPHDVNAAAEWHDFSYSALGTHTHAHTLMRQSNIKQRPSASEHGRRAVAM